MIARFVDGPLAGSDQEYPAETEYVELYGGPDDPHAVMRYVHYGTGVEQNGREVHLFRVEESTIGDFHLPSTIKNGSAIHHWGWVDPATAFDLKLTEEDLQLLKEMKVGV
jgi:hypothetical protein